jgi:hypothetical protein
MIFVVLELSHVLSLHVCTFLPVSLKLRFFFVPEELLCVFSFKNKPWFNKFCYSEYLLFYIWLPVIFLILNLQKIWNALLPSQISETSSAVTCDCFSFYGMKWGKSLIISKHSSTDKPWKISNHVSVCLMYERLKRPSPTYSMRANFVSKDGDIASGPGHAYVAQK